MAEFKKPYDKAYGFWHVTTEGDCEGRSITDLGVFEGNIDTIALALADRCYYYTLYFTAVDPTAYDKTPKKDEINISIYGASGMYAVVCLLQLQKRKTFGSFLKPMEKKCRCNIPFPT